MSASGGPIVDGREWYQPDDLTSYTWYDFNATCPGGLCTGQVGGTGPDLTGWIWASVYEVGDLFHALTPHPGGIASYFDETPLQSPIWAFSFLDLFNDTYYDPLSGVAVVGLTSTLHDSGTPYWGLLGAYINGWIDIEVPEIDGTARTELAPFLYADDRVGAWLYRAEPASAPAPATLSLLTLALVMLASMFRTCRGLIPSPLPR